MARKGRFSRGKAGQNKHAKNRRKLKINESFKEAEEKIGAKIFVYDQKRCSKDFKGDFMDTIPQEYYRIHHGRMAIRDVDIQDIVQVVNFIPFSDSKQEEYNDFQKLTTTFVDLSQSSNSVKDNEAHWGRGVLMYPLGWRGGYDHEYFVGRYVPPKRVQHSKELLEKWIQNQRKGIVWVSNLYRRGFCNLASGLFDYTSKEAVKACALDLSQVEFVNLQQEKGIFASNLMFTIGDFFNSFHQYWDYNTYNYGIWSPIHLKTGELASLDDGFQYIGGEFIIPSYKVYVDFNGHDGIVEIIWRGKQDFHATMESKTSLGFTRVGSSVQINKHLVAKVQKAIREHKDLEKLNSKISGISQILKDKTSI